MGAPSQFDSTVSQIDLINIALSYLNQPEIASLDEQSTAAKLMKLHWPLSVRFLLSQADWSFALDRVEGQHIDEEETEDACKAYPYLPYCFAFPAGLVRLSRLYSTNGEPLDERRMYAIRKWGRAPITDVPYLIIGNKIRATVEEIIIEYVAYTENINVFPPSFMVCLTYELAVRGAKTLVNSASYEQQMKQNLQYELTMAMNKDANQQAEECVY